MADVASRLVEVPIRQLHTKNAHGHRLIDELYSTCAAGQQAALVPDVKHKYFAVFSKALDCFMGTFVLDYVEEVAGDPLLTAADPVDASLLDGALVKEWCERELSAQESQLHAALKSEPLFSQLVGSPELQLRASKAHALVGVLRALGRIRGGAAGASSTSGGVQAELSQALLLQQALQMLSWCVRQGLTGQPGTRSARTGVHASMPEWLRRVQSRRERRPGLGLFLDDMLQALRVPGGYPFSSVANAVYLLGCVVQDASTHSFTTKLGVLAYYLMDLTGDTSVGPDGSCSPLMADLAAAFHLPLATVAAWQASFLLDAAPQASLHPSQIHQPQALLPPASDGGTELGRACALLVAHTQPGLSIKFIEVLVALGRHDTALVIHRGQSAGKAAHSVAGTNVQQARTLMELRLRCGLVAEALQLARAYAHAQPSASARRGALQVLLTSLFEWAVATQQQSQQKQQQPQQQQQQQQQQASGIGSQWARVVLLELCFTQEEEEVLTSWLTDAARRGRSCGDFLPLMLASRGRVTEALGGFKVWSDSRPSGPAAPFPRRPLSPGGPRPGATKSPAAEESAVRASVIDALVNGQARWLTQPSRNVAIAVAEPGSAPPGPPMPDGLMEGLSLQVDPDTPLMHAAFTQQQLGGHRVCAPPPFLRTRMHAHPPHPPPPDAAHTQPPNAPAQPAQATQNLGVDSTSTPGLFRPPLGFDLSGASRGEGGGVGVSGGRGVGLLGAFTAQAEDGMAASDASSLAGGAPAPVVPGGQGGGGGMVFSLGGSGSVQNTPATHTVTMDGGQTSGHSARTVGKRPRNYGGLPGSWL